MNEYGRKPASGSDVAPWRISASVGPVGIGVDIPYQPGLLAEIVRAEVVDPLSLLFKKTLHASDFVSYPVARRGREGIPAEHTVQEVRTRLRGTTRPARSPVQVKVSGVFSPAVLLSSGWWDRAVPSSPAPVGRNDVQRWTYAGFEEWGPSWDFTSESEGGEFFLGQLGSGDEADSILVAAVGERARRIKAGILEAMHTSGKAALAVEVTGLLCHRSLLERQNSQLGFLAARWDTLFNYCLLLDTDRHKITPVAEVPDYYSAYLWQCRCVTDRVKPGKIPKLDDCYFVWEHTDLTKPDAIKYGLDGLQHKVNYLHREYGSTILLQKSGPLVPGRPRLSTASFQHLVGAIGRLDQPAG